MVVSLFVNPAQFDEPADLAAYPRDEERDLALAAAAGVDIVFRPPADEIYPDGFQTWVEVEQLSRGMEGAARDGHFRGVATVCLKLFNIVRPDRAYFGQKDAQQAAVVESRRPRPEPRARDSGAARSCGTPTDSRSARGTSRLSSEERRAALALPRALRSWRRGLPGGRRSRVCGLRHSRPGARSHHRVRGGSSARTATSFWPALFASARLVSSTTSSSQKESHEHSTSRQARARRS